MRCRSGGVYVDGTVGEGGHAEEILKASGPAGYLLALDRDGQALQRARKRLEAFRGRIAFRQENFRDLALALDREGLGPADGILLDLGLSSTQLEQAERGFSFLKEGPLDMRMDQRGSRTAGDLVNRLPERDLARIFREYGEERWAGRIARAVVRTRVGTPIATTTQLSDLILRAVPKRYHGRGIHPATRVFQALRVAVNDELGALEEGLDAAAGRLKPGGRLCVISFHSLEDRRVKHGFRRYEREGRMKVLTRRPVLPGPEEVAANPRSRSAKLRAAERLFDEKEGGRHEEDSLDVGFLGYGAFPAVGA